MSDLLTRDQFRNGTFARDGHKCVVPACGKPADDAHHIIERRLWTVKGEREGYILENGASLCEPHHQFGAETCAIQPQVLRRWIGLKPRIPSDWTPLCSYDKWGVALKLPTRYHIKYPSTPYLPMSPGYDPNDINLVDLKPFLNVPLVITIKMDGSNTQLRQDGVAARNGSHADHVSFDMLKVKHREIAHLIPKNIQIFGEWLYARHSIHYAGVLKLDSLFQPFGVYDADARMFLGWNEVEVWAKRIGCPTVPVVARMQFSEEWALEQHVSRIAQDVIDQGHEGIVVRCAYPFPYGSFEGYETTNGKTKWRVAPIAKYVRANHVQTDTHWTQQRIVRNESLN